MAVAAANGGDVTQGLSPDEGFDMLLRAIAFGEPEVAVSTEDLGALLDHYRRLRAAERLEQLESAPKPGRTLHPRPRLETPFVDPEGEVQERLAEVWREYLGLESGTEEPAN